MRLVTRLTILAAGLAQVELTAAAATSGCGNPVAAGLTRGGQSNTNKLTFTTSSGTVRQYNLHIPTAYDINTPAPLSFSFHGRSETALGHENLCQMSNETWNPNYLVVYPTGIDLQWQGDPASTTDDVSFTLQLLANLSSTYCLDSSRIYAAGKSNGGGFSANILACDPVASNVIAAFAGMSGAFYQTHTDVGCSGDNVTITCNPGRAPIPILETHGTADDTIAYTGGPRRGWCLPSIPRFMTDKGQRAGIGGMNTSTSMYSGNVIRYLYGNNASLSGVVTHYMAYGMGHIWPSVSAGAVFEATPILWDFFNKWTLDNTPISCPSPATYTVAASSTTTITITASSGSSSTAKYSTTTAAPSVGADGYTTMTYPPTCTAINTNIFAVIDSIGVSYLYMCGGGSAGNAYDTWYSVANWTACFNACDSSSGKCTGFTYNTGANFGASTGNCLLKSDVQSFVSTATLLSTRIAGIVRTTSSTVATTAATTTTTAR